MALSGTLSGFMGRKKVTDNLGELLLQGRSQPIMDVVSAAFILDKPFIPHDTQVLRNGA